MEARRDPPEAARAPMIRCVRGEDVSAGWMVVLVWRWRWARAPVTEPVRTMASRGMAAVSRQARKGDVEGERRVGKREKRRVKKRCVGM